MRTHAEADGPDRVLVTRSEAAWLARVSTETVRRWTGPGGGLPVQGSGRSAHIDWEDLKNHLASQGLPAAAHWAWLKEDLSEPPDHPFVDDGQEEASAVARLQAQVDLLTAERDAALSDAENLDHAVMAYRDNWKRRVVPDSPRGIEKL
jgi:hypothetical protein